jgi:hypothetical protein
MQLDALAMSFKQLRGVMQRREFCKLTGGMLLLIPAGLFLVRCGGSGSDQSGNGPMDQPSVNGTKLIYTSNIVEGHAHTFAIEMGAIDMPPANGVSGPSGVTENHSHSVVVSSAQLSSIGTGQTVQVTSGTTEGHAHLFTFLKLA